MVDKLPIETLTPLEVKPEVDMLDVLRTSFVDSDTKLSAPPVALSIGEHTYGQNIYPTRFGTYGNFSAIVGASKSRKTFLKSALLAGYIGGSAQNHFPDIKGHDTKGKYVLDIDTEQSKFDVQRSSKRVLDMIGAAYPKYKSYALREFPSDVRIDFIEYLIREVYKNKVGLVAIDGVADLVIDTNSLEQSNEIVQRLMKLTTESMCHILTVIHLNYGTDKPRGHLGSEVLRKSETVAIVSKNGNLSEVKPRDTRGMPWNEFTFGINNQGIPFETNDQSPF